MTHVDGPSDDQSSREPGLACRLRPRRTPTRPDAEPTVVSTPDPLPTHEMKETNIMNAELKNVQITREALIDKMVEHREDDWDTDDTEDALRHGRIGFEEVPNAELEEIANDVYCMMEEGNEVRYTITDPCPIKATPEEINQEMLEACRRAFATLTDRDDDDLNDTDKQTIVMLGQAIAKAEGNPA